MYSKVLLTSFYDIVATLKLQNKLSEVANKAEEYLKEELKNKK